MKAIVLKAQNDEGYCAVEIIDMPSTNGDAVRAIIGGWMEVFGRGNFGGVPVVVIGDEEGRLKEGIRWNPTAADFLTSATRNAGFIFQGIAGDAVVLYDGEEDWRAFTDEEIAAIRKELDNGGYPVQESSHAL